ncbi:tetratricopeptide repeat protein [Dokdonia ponticola]|uniref:Tetratricopeptide repeat protein n=1 Tax=Dokdonia ponticola TaxID=2041041 RepID=A0ABV9HUB9_9FLAO
MKISSTSSFLFVIVWFFSTTVYTQNAILDSLKLELQKHTEKDTVRVNLLNELAFLHYKKDFDKAFDYVENAQINAEEIDYKKGKARSLYLKGKMQQAQSNYLEAIAQYNNALLVYERLNNWEGIAKCYAAIGYSLHYSGEFNNSIINLKRSIDISSNYGFEAETALPVKFIGYNYLDMGDYDQANTYYDKALAINIKYDNKLEISSCNLNIGSVYLKKGKYPTALEYYTKSLKISEEIKDTIGIAKALNNIGIIYDITNNYDQALTYYDRALEIQKKIGTRRNVAKGLGNLGLVYFGKKDYQNALLHYNEAINISEEINDRDSQARYLTYIGGVYMRLKDHNKAIDNYKEALKINMALGDQLGLCYTYKLLAESYYLQKNYKDALINAQKSNIIANKLGALGFQRDSYDLLAKLYENTGNYKKALISHQQFKIVNDSLFNKENIEKFAQLEAEYKYKKVLDSASIRELKLTKTVKDTSQNLEKSQRNYLRSIIGFLLISMLLGGVIFYLKYRNIKAATHNIIVEQRLLRSQMTPHFIFNSLSVLQGMILNKEEKKSVVYLSKFSKLLRIILENSREKMVLLSQELAAIENYLSLQNLENESYNYTVSIEETIDTNAFEIPPMLIQPFVENAIEHAFTNQLENREIHVRITYEDQKLICTITDNGVGIHSQPIAKRKDKNSLATTITSERLQILSKDFNREGSVTIENRQKYNEQGTLVTLIIPYVKGTFKAAS